MKRDDNALVGIFVLITIVIVMLATFSLGCAEDRGDTALNESDTGDATNDGDSGIVDEQYIRGTAVVEAVDIVILESFPVQIHAVATGYLPDGCTRVEEESIAIVHEDDMFNVSIGTIRPKDMACTEAIVPFEQTVILDVYGLKKGVYTVNINGIESSFELSTDNIITE